AVFRSTGPAADAPDAPGPAATPTAISSPSLTFLARLICDMSVPASAPPAASIASATREPVGRRTSPGRRTLPDTATTTYPVGADDDGCVDAAGATGSTCGRARQASTPTSPATP